MRRLRRDDGFAMIMVIGTASVLVLLVVILFQVTVRALGTHAAHAVRHTSLDAADAGIDDALARLSVDRSWNTGHVLAPGAGEAAAARAALEALAPTGRVRTPTGDYVVLRPSDRRVLWALGYAPNYERATSRRLVRVEFAFPRDPAPAALLTGRDIAMSGGFEVRSGTGVGSGADVHSNVNITGTAGSVSVTGGTFTATGLNQFAPAASGAPARTMPTIDPRLLYAGAVHPSVKPFWTDLCPGGETKEPAGTPCTGPSKPTPAGWSWSWSSKDNTNMWTQSSAGPVGVYYVYRGNAELRTNGDSVQQTIITESSTNRTCPSLGDGAITVQKTKVYAYLPGITLYAGGSLSMVTGSGAYSGLVAAQNSLSLSTASAPGITGWVIAENLCPTDSNSFQGSQLVYQPQVAQPRSGPPQVTSRHEAFGP
ncbi:MAG: hypothetical protein Q8R60_05715 [Mycobacteriales bacterium]|nr:hypothetical protein [Mycobacteriales bacterium]